MILCQEYRILQDQWKNKLNSRIAMESLRFLNNDNLCEMTAGVRQTRGGRLGAHCCLTLSLAPINIW